MNQKMKEVLMEKCKLCGSLALKPKVVTDYQYRTPMGIVTIDGKSTFQECGNCKEVFISGMLIDRWNRLIMSELAKKHGVYSAEELQFSFSILPYSQNELATATGKERSTLTKYKTGDNPIDKLFSNVLQNIIKDWLNNNSNTLDQLREQFIHQDEAIKRVRVS